MENPEDEYTYKFTMKPLIYSTCVIIVLVAVQYLRCKNL